MLQTLRDWLKAVAYVAVGVVTIIATIAIVYITIWGVIALAIGFAIYVVKVGIEDS